MIPMKKLYFITRILFAAVVMFGTTNCHEDKGNYDYTTSSDALTIAQRMSRNPVDQTLCAYVFKQDEEIVIEAEYTINDPNLKESDLTFEWLLRDHAVSTEKTLELENYPSARYYGMILITDTRYNQQYSSEFSFQVDPTYTSGWAVLSEQDGFAQLGYLYKDANSGEFNFIGDVYANANEGAKIETGVTEMRSHIYSNANSGYLFGLSIVQPGTEGPIDLNPQDMSVWGKIKDNFLNNAAASLNFKGVIYKDESVYAITESGDLYIRDEGIYANSVVPHTGKFPSEPVYSAEKLNITKWINNSPFSNMMVYMPHVPVYNEAGKKCLLIKKGTVTPFTSVFYTNGNDEPHMPGDPGWDGKTSYPDLQFPGPEDLSGYKVISMEGCGYDTAAWIFDEDPFMVVAMFLQRESDGKYFLFSFDLYEKSNNYDVDLSLFYPLPADIDIDPATMLTCGCAGSSSRPGFFFTTRGNTELHYTDASNGVHQKVYTATSPITAMHTGEVNNAMGMYGEPGIYYNMFVVGTQAGDVTILDMSDEALVLGNASVLHSVNPGVGKITCIEYLPNDAVSY